MNVYRLSITLILESTTRWAAHPMHMTAVLPASKLMQALAVHSPFQSKEAVVTSYLRATDHAILRSRTQDLWLAQLRMTMW